MRTKRSMLLISSVLLLALMLTTPVFAEGEAPSEEPAPAEDAPAEAPVEPPAEAPAEAEEAPADAEEAPADAEEAPADAAPEEPEAEAAEAEAEQPASDQSPEETSAEEAQPEEAAQESPAGKAEEPVPQEEEIVEAVNVAQELSENGLELALPDGEALDMASEETAEALVAPDPYFKIGTTVYSFTTADCDPGPAVTPCPNPIQAAIDYIETNGTLPSDRKIYVESGSFQGFSLDGNGKTYINQINGVIGEDGSDVTSLTSGVTVQYLDDGFTFAGFSLSDEVWLHHINGNVTVEDVVVTGSSDKGLNIHHVKGHVTVDGVKSQNNDTGGAFISNDDDALVYNVTIKNAYFDDSQFSSGLEIETLGNITFDNVSASRNNLAGINVNTNFSKLTVKNLTLNGNNGEGLNAQTTKSATITMSNVYGNGNNTTIGYSVIRLGTFGNITIKSMHLVDNTEHGLYIYEPTSKGSVKIYDSSFNDNQGGDGLHIATIGTIYLSSIKANDNGRWGAYLDNCQDAGGCAGAAGITITSSSSAGIYGANEFSRNTSHGLTVISGRTISLTNINADENGGHGVSAYNTGGSGSISLKKKIKSTDYFTYNNTAIDNGENGVEFDANGSITVEYLVANENDWTGIDLDNDNASRSYGITVKYAEASDNRNYGLRAYSLGSIKATNIIANRNGSAGTYDGAYFYTLAGTSGGVTISSSKGFINQFNENTRRGLYMDVMGNVSLTKVEANENQISTYISNSDGGTVVRSVKIKYGEFSRSAIGYGLEIDSLGSVKLDYVDANDNDDGGVIIGITYRPGTVSVKYGNFNNNDWDGGTYDGLVVYSHKNITLYAVNANNNGATGVYLDNCLQNGFECVGTGAVSIKSKKGLYNTFNDNDGRGLFVRSSGNISVYYVQAIGNNSTGVHLEGNWWDSAGTISVNGSSSQPNLIYNNDGYGIYTNANGKVSWKYIDAWGNTDGGGFLDNTGAITPKTVYVGESTFNKNFDESVLYTTAGLEIRSLGNITLQGVEASDNSVFHGTLDVGGDLVTDVLSHSYPVDTWTTTVASAGTFNITLDSKFFDVYLEVYNPDGTLLDSADNGGSGTTATINIGYTQVGDYEILVMVKDGLWGGGLYQLNLNNDTSNEHTAYSGIVINNEYGTANGSVNIKYSSKRKYGVRVWNNSYYGVSIQSDGAVSATKSEIAYNGMLGLTAANQDDAEKGISISSMEITGNGNIGLYLYSRGAITLSKVTSTNNAFSACHLTNTPSLVPRNVKVSNSVCSGTMDSGSDGLQIYSKGDVTLSGVVAENPLGRRGVYIDNSYGDEGKVTVIGKGNVFDNNKTIGLYIYTKGHVSLSNFSARNNGDQGIYVNNGLSGVMDKYVKITASKGFNDITGNGGRGMDIFSYGIVTINKVNASDNNNLSWIYTVNNPGIAKVAVTNSLFNNNGSVGLLLQAKGYVYLSNVTASDNNANGITLENDSAAGEDVVVKKSMFFRNDGHGIVINSLGFVNVSDVDAFQNTVGHGIEVNNWDGGTEGVTLLKCNLHNNSISGADIATRGPVTLTTINANNNGYAGVYVIGYGNDTATVNLSRVNTAYNLGVGVWMQYVSNVTISLSNFIHNGDSSSDGDGLYVRGNLSNTIVTISKSSFLDNFGNGIEFYEVGPYTITSSLNFANDIDGDEGGLNFYDH